MDIVVHHILDDRQGARREPMSDRSSKPRVALITGASRGIGAGIARRFAAEGFRIAVTARTLNEGDSSIPGSLSATVNAIRSGGGTAISIVADLANPEHARSEIIAEVDRALGPVQVLVNNAAAYLDHPVEEINPKRFGIAIELNLHAPLELVQAVLPGMRECGAGWILNISSATAAMPRQHPRQGRSGPLLYAATKAALDRATVALAEELHPERIAVNSLAPQAGVVTAATQQYYALPEDAIEPVETMAAAAFALCSGDPQELTGQVVRSLDFLVGRGEPVHALDGRSLLEGWQPDEIPAARLDRAGSVDEGKLRSD
jgi:NAD(P)-dependent dehydrogenase (short-subunit alcohol dehydrogenase family)